MHGSPGVQSGGGGGAKLHSIAAGVSTPVGGAAGRGGAVVREGEGTGVTMVNLTYDPMLNCYYDPRTQQYYEV